MADYQLGKGFLWQGGAASRGFFVQAGSVAWSANAISAITQIGIGVLQESVSAADAATGKLVVPIWLPGSISRMVAAAAITKGAKVAPSVNGRAQVAVTTQFPVGIAMTAAANANDEIDVMLVAPMALVL